MPRWQRSIISVVLVTFLAYLAFDFTSYLIMRSLDGVTLRAPLVRLHYWFREPFALKWFIISQADLRFCPRFGSSHAGILQVLVLEGDVTFGWGFLIVILQTVASVIGVYRVVALRRRYPDGGSPHARRACRDGLVPHMTDEPEQREPAR